MREIEFRYVWKRPLSGAGSYCPSDPKFKLIHISIEDLENKYSEKTHEAPPFTFENGHSLGCYSILVSRDLFTSKKDKNNKKIFEHDILAFFDKLSYKRKTIKTYGQVIFDEGIFKIVPTPTRWNDLFFSLLGSTLEIVGNKWQNPELLEEKL